MPSYLGARVTVVHTPHDLAQHAALTTAFFAEYASDDHFPDEDEREDPAMIHGRLEAQGALDDMYTHLVAVQLQDALHGWRFAGGMVVEYYPASASCLLTYLFVAVPFRGAMTIEGKPSGVAKLLLHSERGMAQARKSGMGGGRWRWRWRWR